MTSSRILIVDDEPDFVRFLDDVLKPENFVVTVAEDGVKALKMAAASVPDLILLDWNLPGKDGIEVCKALRANPKTEHIPIIMLTARGRETDTVLGLEMGANDFITKRALRPRELIARVRTALRKAGTGAGDATEILRSGELVLDTAQRKVCVGDREVDLRRKEFDLLYIFMKKAGRVLTRNFLTETVWGEQFFGTSRTVDTTIARLRAELGKEGRKIEAIQGVGYKFNQ
ncbi:MAG: response regulator transcription factor [Elusimicrobia bacterium]|nr:response regulator transcription factor [Elusimicrobiota bacterium]